MGRKKIVEEKEEKVAPVPTTSGKKKRRESQNTKNLRKMKAEQKGDKPIFRKSTFNRKAKEVLSDFCEKYNSDTQRLSKESRALLKSFVTAELLQELTLCSKVMESEKVSTLFPKHVEVVEAIRNA